jgi:hypothetical protein
MRTKQITGGRSMRLNIIHLSDFHLSEESAKNLLLERKEALFGAVRSVLNSGEDCLVVYSGDIACKGKIKEYEMAETLLLELNDTISGAIGRSPYHVMVPGNHDLDFGLSADENEIREAVIKQMGPKIPLSKVKEACCLKPQANYFNFVEKLSKTINLLYSSTVIETSLFTTTFGAIRFTLINSAFISEIEEKYGHLWLPEQEINDALRQPYDPNNLTITIVHHPYSWFEPDNAREVRKILEEFNDIIITGHEHDSGVQLRSKRPTEQNFYVEGGVIQDPKNHVRSSFNIIKIDMESHIFSSVTYDLKGDVYIPSTESYEHKFLRFRQNAVRGFKLEDSWIEWLNQVGTDFRHPRKTLLLDDIFVYPDLQRLKIGKTYNAAGIIKDGDILGFILGKKRVCIAGAEKTGKTCLAKRLFKDLMTAGYVPAFINSSFCLLGSKKQSIADRFKISVSGQLEGIYTAESREKFWHLETKDRAIIIDNYHEIQLNVQGRDEFLGWCDKAFEIVVIITDPGTRIAEVLNQKGNQVRLLTYEHADILEADLETTHQLIRKWLLAGHDKFTEDLEQIHLKTIRYGQSLRGLIGQGIVPSLPLYILMMTQQLHSHGTLEGTNGLYGAMYEKIIIDVLSNSAEDFSDFDIKINYLTEFSYALHQKGIHLMDETDFSEWHQHYCDAFNRNINPIDFVSFFRKLGVFRSDTIETGFKYKYYYCYFLAKYLASHFHESAIQGEVDHLCKKLYITDVANTMVFLCHLSFDPKVLKVVLDTLKNHFIGREEFDIRLKPLILPSEPIRIPLSLDDKDEVEKRHADQCKDIDELGRPHGLDAFDEGEHIDEEGMKVINEINSTVHSIRICGQILRNSYGSMKGDVQIEIIKECYAACLRLMTVFFNIMAEDRDKISQNIAETLKNRYPKLSDAELDKTVRSSIYGWALQICYGLVKHASNSLGLAALKPSYDKLIISAGITPGHRLLDVSTRLDYLDEFPEGTVNDVHDILRTSFLGNEVLRILVWEHFKLFHSEFRLRQRVCSRLGINSNEAAFLRAEGKRDEAL